MNTYREGGGEVDLKGTLPGPGGGGGGAAFLGLPRVRIHSQYTIHSQLIA